MEARKKTGRNPKGQFKRSSRMQLRLSPTERETLKYAADLYTVLAGKSKSIPDVIIRAVEYYISQNVKSLNQTEIEENNLGSLPIIDFNTDINGLGELP